MVGVISPAFALICQYLSSTVRDLTHSTFSPRRREIRGLPHLHERNNLWKQLLRWRRLKRTSLSDAEKLTQAEGEINVNREDKRVKPELLLGGGGMCY